MKPKDLVNQGSASELTIAKLRSYSGFEDYTDEQAQQAIQNIKQLAKILFSIYQQQTRPENPIK